MLSANRPLGSLFSMLGNVDAVHGTYYVFLHFFVDLFGSSSFAVRFPSAVAVGFAVAAVVVLATRISTPAVAVSAGLICCVLPRLTYVGSEGRSFAFSVAVVSWLTVMLVVALTSPRGVRVRFWIGYAALLTAGIYLFLYVGLFIVVHLAVLLVARSSRRLLLAWFCASAAAVLAAIPLLAFAYLERSQIAYLTTTNQVGAHTLFVSLWFGNNVLAVAAWALILVAVVTVASRARRTHRGTDPGAPGRTVSLEAVAIAWLFIPSGILVGGQFAYPGFTARYLAFCTPAAAILIACAIAFLCRGRRWMIAFGVLLIVALAAPSYLEQRTVYAKNDSDWSVVSQFMAENARQGDAVAFDETIRPSRRPRLGQYMYPEGYTKTTDVALKTPYARNSTWYDSAYTIQHAADRGRFEGVDRVWMIEWASPTVADDYGRADLATLGFTVTSTHTFHRTVVFEYQRIR